MVECSRLALAQTLTGETDQGEERQAVGLGGLGTDETDQGERKADKAQGTCRLRGLYASTDRQEQPWRL